MRIPRIYTQSDLHEFSSIDLEAKAHKHIKDVLRMTLGDKVILFNGNGYDYHGDIQKISKNPQFGKSFKVRHSTRNCEP